MTPVPASRRDQVLDDSVAVLRMVIAQLRELDGPSRAVAAEAGGSAAHHASSPERSDRH